MGLKQRKKDTQGMSTSATYTNTSHNSDYKAQDSKSQEDIKKRYWSFFVYPDSAPVDWKERLKEKGLPFSISPLHDKDIDEGGIPKKAHYHVMICFRGPTTFNVMNKICKELNQPKPMATESVTGQYDYFTHRNNPEKAQYKASDIENVNGFNIYDHRDITKSEMIELRKTAMNLIKEYNITEYSTLVDLVMEEYDDDLFNMVTTQTIFFRGYLNSRRHSKTTRECSYENILKRREKVEYDYDEDTGEVIEVKQ